MNDLGYLMIDHRAIGEGLAEYGTYTCTHCSAVVVLNPDRKRERGKCYQCNHLICDRCAVIYSATRECRNILRVAEERMRQLERQTDAPAPIILP